MKPHLRSLATLPVIALLAVTVGAQERDRSKIPDKYKWNLADIYPSDASWRAAKEAFAAEVPTLEKFKGKLTTSPAALADALDTIYSKNKEFRRLASYASLLADQDTRDSQHQGMRQEMTQVAAAFGAAVAFVDPEILKAGKATIDRFMSTEPRLKPYRHELDDTLRRAAHTLSDNEEKILADAGPMAGSASSTYNIIANADF